MTAPGGWCFMLVPLDPDHATGAGGAAITDPAAHEAAFLQHDHVRPLRPRRARNGSRRRVSPSNGPPPRGLRDDVMRQAGLLDVDWLFLCR